MSDKRLRKIKYLLALANDAEDEESMTALPLLILKVTFTMKLNWVN